MNAHRRARVVVGVAESLAGLQALRFAVEEARRRGVSVLAVRAWEFAAPWRGYDVDQCRRELAEDAAATTRRAFDSAMAGLPSDVTVEALAVEEPAGMALVACAVYDDDVIVVGATTRWAWWARPSVARYCLRHANCPVVTVPPPALARQGRPGALSRAVQREARRYAEADPRDASN